jgi:hypothetical protein
LLDTCILLALIIISVIKGREFIPPANADEQNDTTNVANAMLRQPTHFLVLLHVIGFLGSFSIHSTT